MVSSGHWERVGKVTVKEVGRGVGRCVGLFVGVRVGSLVGLDVGTRVGEAVVGTQISAVNERK